MTKAVHARRRKRPRNEDAVRRSDLGDTCDVQKLAARGVLDLAPELVGPAHERDVGWMLEIGEPDDARRAVRGAAVVAGRKSLDPDHAARRARERVERCAAHRAKPANRDIVMVHASGLSVARVPVALEIGNQRGTEAAIRLITRIGRAVAAEQIKRFLTDAQRAAIADGAGRAGIGQALDRLRDGIVEIAGRDDLVADEPALGAVALDASLLHDAWRAIRSPVKRGSRRFAAPGMMPSLRAGKVRKGIVRCHDVVDRQQDTGNGRRWQSLDYRDPWLLDTVSKDFIGRASGRARPR